MHINNTTNLIFYQITISTKLFGRVKQISLIALKLIHTLNNVNLISIDNKM